MPVPEGLPLSFLEEKGRGVIHNTTARQDLQIAFPTKNAGKPPPLRH
jgi:hypothetical protein